jgi:NADH:ubiquinone oxidoreductase subunit D
MKYKNLTSDEVAELHARCFTRYYFRWEYLRQNAHLLWPALQKLPPWRNRPSRIESDSGHQVPPRPKSGLEILQQSPSLRKDGPHVHTLTHQASDAQLRQ